ncbi:MAG: pilus assembly protein [Sphingomonadales bacterium]|jgi:hypothetical protein
MNMRSPYQLLKREDGAAAVELAIVALFFFVIFFAILDFGRLWYTYNVAEKATQVGARYAVVALPVYPTLQDFDAIDAGVAVGNGERLGPLALGEVTCTSTTCTCTETAGGNCAALPNESTDDTAFEDIVFRMQMMMPQIQPENVTITYRHVGLGFAGNPFGPDYSPTVTVRLTGMTFDFVTPTLLGLGSVNLPAYATTLTGEDYGS